jgi:hypothetical protein
MFRVQLALRKIVANVLDQPSELRFRRLRRSNSTLATKVLPIPGAEGLLHAIGFETTSVNEHAESVLFLSAASVDEPLLRQALIGLDDLIEVLRSVVAPAPHVASPSIPGETAAGTPVSLQRWDSRFRRSTCVVTMFRAAARQVPSHPQLKFLADVFHITVQQPSEDMDKRGGRWPDAGATVCKTVRTGVFW